MGVFFGGCNSSIGQNCFFDNTAPTQGGNDVSIIVVIVVLQYTDSIDANSVQQYLQTSR